MFKLIIVIIILIIILIWGINWKGNNLGNSQFSYSGNSQFHRKNMTLPLWWENETGLYKTKINLSSNISNTNTNTNYTNNTNTNNNANNANINTNYTNNTNTNNNSSNNANNANTNNSSNSSEERKNREFIVIPDTGSNILIITGPECERCVPEMGVWDYSIGSGNKEIRKEIRYGGGQITEFIPWHAHLVEFDNQEIDLGVIISSKIQEGPPQNIMGLQPRSEGFLSSLGKERSILFDFPNQKLQIGDLDYQIPPEASSFSMIPYPFSTSSIQFIASKIEKLSINQIPVPESIKPLYATFDTGTTNTIVPKKLLNYLRTNFPNGIKTATIRFSQEDDSNQKYSPEVVFTPPSQSTIHDQIDENTMMIGNRWLSQFVFGIEYNDMKLFLF